MVNNYTFTIIEDTKVPLAATFDSGLNVPVILAVVVMALFVSLLAYTAWFVSHQSHIRILSGNENEAEVLHYYAHPRRLLQREYEIENNIVHQYIA